jgi:hypothetical protein
MNSVAQNRVGIASGVNNAVARGAGLLAIAGLGIVMLQSFNQALDQRLVAANVPPAAWQSLQTERTKLAAASLPHGLDQATQQLVGQTIAESFVHAFRLIMAIGATLAAVSAIVAWVLIGKPPAHSAKGATDISPGREAGDWLWNARRSVVQWRMLAES